MPKGLLASLGHYPNTLNQITSTAVHLTRSLFCATSTEHTELSMCAAEKATRNFKIKMASCSSTIKEMQTVPQDVTKRLHFA